MFKSIISPGNEGRRLYIVIAVVVFASVLLLSSAFGEIVLDVPNGNTTKDNVGTESDTTFPQFQISTKGPWLDYGALSSGVNVTSYVTDEALSGSYFDVFNINIAGLMSVNMSYNHPATEIKVGAFMNQSINAYNVSNLEITRQLIGSYNGTGVNITTPHSITIPSSYEYTASLAAVGLDIATDSPYPSLAVSAAFFFAHQETNNYDSSLSSGDSVYGTAKFFQTYDVNSEPYLAENYSALAQTAIQWAIPYSEVDQGQAYTLTLFTAAFYQYTDQWNYTYTNLGITDQYGGGGGCVAWGSPILTPNGYIPIQDLKKNSVVEEYDYGTNSLVTGTLLYKNVTRVQQIVQINEGLLNLTPIDQPIYIKNSTFQGWMRSPENLTVGDQIFNPVNDGWINVTNVSLINEKVKVYDVVTSGFNNFIDNGILLDTKTG